MGLLDGVLGGLVGGVFSTVIKDVIDKHGGIQGIAEQFERQGLGPTIQSWIGNGPNQPISPEQVQQVLGSDSVNQLAAKTGISPAELYAKLAELLPKAIDQATPNGSLPSR